MDAEFGKRLLKILGEIGRDVKRMADALEKLGTTPEK